MHLPTILSILLAGAPIAHSTRVSVAYHESFNYAETSLTTVACSDGANGLITRYGWHTIGEVPANVAASSTVSGWNSDTCGSCYSLQYNDQTIYFIAIDSKPDGVDLSEKAMDMLTNGRAYELGRVEAELTQVGVDKCGLVTKREITWSG